MRKTTICALIILASVNFFLLFYPFKNEAKPVVIPQYSNSAQIAGMLKEHRIIKSKIHFLMTGQIFKIFHTVKAGEYDFGMRVSTYRILKKLARGEVKIHRIIIPEGGKTLDIGISLADEGLVSLKEFLNLVNNSDFEVDSYKFPKKLEGYLFPDTYFFIKGIDTESSIILMMLSQFKKEVIDVFEDEMKKTGYSLDRIIILASLIEKEALVDFERPVISRVFYNRLKRKMPLQCDPTVRYALEKFDGKLTNNDLKVKSIFNTYVHRGLPPYPICNPGIASIKAALRPANVDYLYFVSKNDGTHFFTRIYGEHIRAKKKYQGS